MRWVWAWAAVAGILLAGCSGSDDASDGGTTTGAATTTRAATTGPGGGGGGGGGGGSGASVSLTADVTTGTAPLNVTFGFSVAGGEVSSWRFGYGDGSEALTGGADVPATLSHTYTVGGNFTAALNVTFKGGAKREDTVAIVVDVPNSGPPPPAEFPLGQAAGCDNALVPVACVSFQLGPNYSGVDGHWVALDDRYWGLTFTSTMEPAAYHDTDCFFVASDGTTVLGDANNVDQACGGIVPTNTAWLFIYSYAVPHQSMLVVFAV